MSDDKQDIRDIDADYLKAYLFEYNTARRVGRDETAAEIAEILRNRYDHEVEPASEKAPEPPIENVAGDKASEPRQKRPYNKRQPQERADLKPAPEKAVEPKPEHPSED